MSARGEGSVFGNILADPGFDAVGDDGAFVFWNTPNPTVRAAGTPDRGACRLSFRLDDGIPAGDACVQFDRDIWEVSPTGGDIEEASFRFRCSHDGCPMLIDIAIPREGETCEDDLTDREGEPLELGVDWFLVAPSFAPVCVYRQLFFVDQGWDRYDFILGIPDRTVNSIGAVYVGEAGQTVWADDAVLAADD